MSKLLDIDYWKTATPQSVQEQIDGGADVNARDEDGWTALMWASRFHQNPEIITTLIANGADVNARNKLRKTALMLASGYNKNPAVITTLIINGAALNARDKWGHSVRDHMQENNALKHTYTGK